MSEKLIQEERDILLGSLKNWGNIEKGATPRWSDFLRGVFSAYSVIGGYLDIPELTEAAEMKKKELEREVAA